MQHKSSCIVDASWVLDCLVGEPSVQRAALCVGEKVAERRAPSLWRYEVVNALWQLERNGKVRADAVQRLLCNLGAMVQVSIDALKESDIRSFAHARGLRTCYDASYALLAQTSGLFLFTRDEEILTKCPDLARRYDQV